MEPSLIHSLIGNLGLHGDFSTKVTDSPASGKTKQKNKNKKGVQVVININDVATSYNKPLAQTEKATYGEGFHAVFLEDGQVYFGKMGRVVSGQSFVSLKNVYYLR